jgi:hypothetical protein
MNKTIQLNHLIFEKIKFRYDFFDTQRVYNRNQQNKLLLDSFYPFVLAKEIAFPANGVLKIGSKVARDGYAISERVAEDLGCKKLHISELITMLGYTKTDISKLLQSVKNKQLSLLLVGLGGTGSNFIHWMSEMSEWTGKSKIFYKLSMYDDDDFDIPNMLRIPFIPEFRAVSHDSKKVHCLPGKSLQLAEHTYKYQERLSAGNLMPTRVGPTTSSIIYGAPDIETRSWLSSSDFTFIAATHRDSEFSLVENPTVDDDLMMETYGKINLSKFLLNHLTMTIKFLEHLRDRDRAYGVEGEHEILRANFDEMYRPQLETGFKAGAKKVYVFSGESVELNVEEGT